MSFKRFTLLTDGSSDRALLPILDWLIRQQTSVIFGSQWADLARLPMPPKGLAQRIAKAIELYPCDILFVHRDAERELRESRVQEILGASQGHNLPVVCVVPVRMQEAWLLFEEQAIRLAAGCPNGTMRLEMPNFARIEREPDPKKVLHGLLLAASGLSGRRARHFPANLHAYRLSQVLDDFSPLRQLDAFRALEADLIRNLRALGCGTNLVEPRTADDTTPPTRPFARTGSRRARSA